MKIWPWVCGGWFACTAGCYALCPGRNRWPHNQSWQLALVSCTPPQSPQHTWTASLASVLRLLDVHQEWPPAAPSMIFLTRKKRKDNKCFWHQWWEAKYYTRVSQWRKEKKTKDYACFWHQFDEKPSMTPGCQGSHNEQASNKHAGVCWGVKLKGGWLLPDVLWTSVWLMP